MRQLIVLAVLAVLNAPAALLADDWPQWRGPNRDNKSNETGLIKNWKANPPQLLWTARDLGNGYSGPAIIGNRLYSMGGSEDGNKEFVFCLDTKTGQELWRVEIASFFENAWGGGPRSTPTIDGDRLYALGGSGELACLKTADGSKVWSVNLKDDLDGKVMKIWGYSESVLVDGDRVICSPGAAKGTLAALDKMSGKVIWRSKELTDEASYSSMIPATIGGIKQYIQMTAEGVVGVRADNGELLWQSELGSNGVAVIPTPIVKGNRVFVTSNYPDGECGLVELTVANGKIQAKDVYEHDLLKNHHGGVLLYDGYLYGHAQPRRSRRNEWGWVCMNFDDGEVAWSYPDFPKGSVTFADGRLYCYSEKDGTLACAGASPKGWQEFGRLKIPQESKIRSRRGGVWTHPVIANGILYLRDQDLLFAYDIQAK